MKLEEEYDDTFLAGNGLVPKLRPWNGTRVCMKALCARLHQVRNLFNFWVRIWTGAVQ